MPLMRIRIDSPMGTLTAPRATERIKAVVRKRMRSPYKVFLLLENIRIYGRSHEFNALDDMVRD